MRYMGHAIIIRSCTRSTTLLLDVLIQHWYRGLHKPLWNIRLPSAFLYMLGSVQNPQQGITSSFYSVSYSKKQRERHLTPVFQDTIEESPTFQPSLLSSHTRFQREPTSFTTTSSSHDICTLARTIVSFFGLVVLFTSLRSVSSLTRQKSRPSKRRIVIYHCKLNSPFEKTPHINYCWIHAAIALFPSRQYSIS